MSAGSRDGAGKTNGSSGARSKAPPPIKPFAKHREAQKLQGVTVSHQQQSPSQISPPPRQPIPSPHQSTHSTQQSGGYEEPVLLRQGADRGSVNRPEVHSAGSVYSEVNTKAPITVQLLAKSDSSDNCEYNVTTHHTTTNSNDIPDRPVVHGTSYSHLDLNPQPTKSAVAESGQSLPSKKPPIAAKPKIPGRPAPHGTSKPKVSTKPKESPPKPKRTYMTNAQDLDDKKFKPMPLPRSKPSDQPSSTGPPVTISPQSSEQDQRNSSETTKGNDSSGTPQLAYSYVTIDVPDSPTDSTPSIDNTTATDSATAGQNSAISNQKPAVSSEVAGKPTKRRVPPPPPPSKPKPSLPLAPIPKKDEENKGTYTAATFPHSVKQQPKKNVGMIRNIFNRKSAQAEQTSAVPSCTTNAGSTPPKKRKDSFLRIKNRDKKKQASKGQPADTQPSSVPLEQSLQPVAVVGNDEWDCEDSMGYATVGAGGLAMVGTDKKQPVMGTDKKQPVKEQPQKILAAYAEVNLSQKTSRRTERRLSGSHSVEELDKLAGGSGSTDISQFATLPRNRRKPASANSSPQTHQPVMVKRVNPPALPKHPRSASLSDERPQTPPRTLDTLTLIPTPPGSPHETRGYNKTMSLERGAYLKKKTKPAPLPPSPSFTPSVEPNSTGVISMYSVVGRPRDASPLSTSASSNGPSRESSSAPADPVGMTIDQDIIVTSTDKNIGASVDQSGEEETLHQASTASSGPFLFKDKRKFLTVKPDPETESAESSDAYDSFTDNDDDEPPSAGPAKSKTYNIANELLTTERTFVKGLTLLDKEFRQTVLSANRAHDKPLLADDALKTILSNVGSLCILNGGLLSQLETRLAEWDSNPRIGDILANTAPFFKLYTEYISNFDKALKCLDDSCKTNKAFGQLVREFESQSLCAQLPLSGYLLETVQRIPRYKLLLQDYLKHLPDDSPDQEDTKKALELISMVASHVNQSIKEMDNFKKLIEVQKKLTGDTGDYLISPSRKLLKEGELLKYSRKEIQSRMFFLFTDMLLYASAVPPANTTYRVIKRIPLQGMKVTELDDPEVKHGLQIISTCKSFRLGTTTEEEKRKWKEALDDALYEHESMIQSRQRDRLKSISAAKELDSNTFDFSQAPLGTLAPPWLPDSCVSMCMICCVRFSLTKRRHHCRACGNIYCSTCSSYLAQLKYQDNKLDRVCLTCYDTLTQGPQMVAGKKLSDSGKRKEKAKATVSSVLDVKARGRECEISGYLQMKEKKWKKLWLEVAEFALYVYEKHEDVSANRSVSLPGYKLIYPIMSGDSDDKSMFCLTHPGTGTLYFKADSPETAEKWVEVFQNAIKLKSTTNES